MPVVFPDERDEPLEDPPESSDRFESAFFFPLAEPLPLEPEGGGGGGKSGVPEFPPLGGGGGGRSGVDFFAGGGGRLTSARAGNESATIDVVNRSARGRRAFTIPKLV